MSLSVGSSKSKSTTKQKSQTDPWDTATPYIENFLGKLPGAQGVTSEQSAAFQQLKDNVSQGNPYASEIDAAARGALGTESQAPVVNDAYATYLRRMGGVADGTNQNIGEDPYLQKLLQQVGDEAQQRVNAQFAAAGRDSSGMNQQSVARGVTSAQLPILVEQLNRERARTDAAAGSLFGAGNTTAQTAQSLNDAAIGSQMRGLDLSKAAIDAQNFGPTQIINLEEQLKNLPLDNAAKLAEILFSAGQLGQQTEGTSNTKGKTSSFGLGLKLI